MARSGVNRLATSKKQAKTKGAKVFPNDAGKKKGGKKK